MNDEPVIPGGYILYPRQFLDLLAETSLLDRVLWTWLNCQANHRQRRDHLGTLARGELLTTSLSIREALSHRAGCSLRRPSKSAVWRALERLRRRNLIATRRTTRGLIITICDYALYQDPTRYERHATAPSETAGADLDRQEDKNEKKGKAPPAASRLKVPKSFEQIDRERAAAALARAQEEFLADDQA